MTENDIVQRPITGQWVQIDPQQSELVLTSQMSQPTITRLRAVEDVPVTNGIVLDQKVLIPLVLLLGVIAGVVLIMILDRYSKNNRG